MFDGRQTKDAEPRPHAEARKWTRVGAALGPYGVVIAFVLLGLGYSIALPNSFPTSGNFYAIVSSQQILFILALAVIIPLRSGDFDLSVAAVMTFCAAEVGILSTQDHVAPVLAMGIGVATGAAIGGFNAIMIVALRLDAFVTTLGTQTVVLGFTYWITNTQVVTNLPATILSFSRSETFGIPHATYFGWIIALLLLYIFEFTPLGRYLLVVGKSRESARLAGISVTRIRFGAFITAGLLSGFAGVVLAGTLGAVDPTLGPQYLLQPYAAAFLGATTIRIGQFNVLGTVVALYLLVVGITGLELIGVADWIAEVFNGGALLAAILFARVTNLRSTNRETGAHGG